jgi:hydrogenase expression/formation protein HypC
MCLAIPGKVISIDRSTTPVMGSVDFSGIQRKICLEWLPEIQIGDYVIVHVGFAISKIDEQDAVETLKLFEQMGELPDEPGPEGPGSDPGAR